jgi:hypothetical protein
MRIHRRDAKHAENKKFIGFYSVGLYETYSPLRVTRPLLCHSRVGGNPVSP